MLSNKAMSAAKAVEPAYVEDVFSTYLYTGNSSTQTINNGIDLAGKGGLVWLKGRSLAVGHYLYDTNRGIANGPLSSENNNAAYTANTPKTLTSFNSNGFSMQDDSATFGANVSPRTQVSWTFRKQPKFFDVVAWTGDGVTGREIPHSLGSAPGFVLIKSTSSANSWVAWHRSLSGQTGILNTTNAFSTDQEFYLGNGVIPINPTSTVLTVATGGSVNFLGATYVAYLFAHDAGGFGLSGNENVVSCGSFTYDSTNGNNINLGYETQFVILKDATNASQWYMQDVMRGMTAGPTSGARLFPNLSNAEDTGFIVGANATGFNVTPSFFSSGANIIYIAIRRGPMKVPTDGTKVYNAIARTGTGAAATVTGVGFTPDWLFTKSRSNVTGSMVADRLRGEPYLQTTSNTGQSAETTNTAVIDKTAFSTTMDGFRLSASSTLNNWSPYTYINYLFKRAPSFFDEVCWTGNNSANQRVNHNLAVVPELIIYKGRNKVNYWRVYFGNINKYIQLDEAFAEVSGSNLWGSSAPTTTDFGINCGSMDLDNFNAVAYLFASAPGVSKVGSYTGTGTTQVINCGFTTGARFVLIKRTDSTASWYVWDTVRGMVSGTDPSLQINWTSPEINGDSVFTATTGFQIVASPAVDINASGGSYIFLAVA